MLRIAVCDDVRFQVEWLAKCIADWSRKRGITTQIVKFYTGEEVLFEIENSGDFTAVFLDIKLTGMNGIETAERIREQNRFVSIVFVSGYDSYFREMFYGRYPIQFLDKPVEKSEVFQLMDQIVGQQRGIFESYQFQYNHHTYTINLQEVLYFVSEGRLVRIMLETGEEYVLYDKLDDIEGNLCLYRNPFVRIHQSYLVNSLQIVKCHRRKVTLRDETILPVSRGKKEEIIQFQMRQLAKGR